MKTIAPRWSSTASSQHPWFIVCTGCSKYREKRILINENNSKEKKVKAIFPGEPRISTRKTKR